LLRDELVGLKATVEAEKSASQKSHTCVWY
jgi:hypothetical protein